MHTTKIDVEAKKEKEKADLAKSDCKTCTLPYYGKEIPLSLNFFDKAKPKKLEDGGEVWLLKLDTKDWHGVQFFFENFYLPEGSELFFYNEKKDMELGAFTSQNNREDGQFITQPLLGDKVYIEYYQPSEVNEQAILELGAAVCIFDDSFLRKGPFSKEASPTCNVNTSCSDAFGWDEEVKSVGLILEKDASNTYWGICSGVLINKYTPYSGSDKPLFLSANHCYESYKNYTSTFSNTANWVFLFRHEGLSCSDDGTTITRSYTKSVTGATVLKADLHSRTSDYLLLQLNSTVDQISNFDISFSGWSKEDIDGITDKSVAIHHPQGDIKKYTYTTNIPVSATNDYNNNAYAGGLNALWKVTWTNGATAPGSSGGPLFNNDHKIIGQLYYGASTCDYPRQPDYYGKFSRSFQNGNFQDYLGNTATVQNYTPSKPALDLTITSNPSLVSPGSNATFTASSSNKFGNLYCWWVINTEQGDLDVTCNANTDALCYSSNTNPTQSYYFGSGGNYKITLFATDDAGKQGSKEFILNVRDGGNDCIWVNLDGKNDCENTRIFSLGSNLQLTDYASVPHFYSGPCVAWTNGPSIYDGIKTIKWYYDGNLKTTYSFNKTSNCFEGDNCYWWGAAPGCFPLTTAGKHIIKLEAYAGKFVSGSFVQTGTPSSISKEINVIDCNATKDISSQSILNASNGYIGDGIVLLNPPIGSSIIVNTGGHLTVDTYNKAIIKPGVKFAEGSSCIIKAFNCPSSDCGCSALKSAKINNSISESVNTLDDKINVYPNPVDSYAIVDLGERYREVVKIELFEATGKLLFNQDCNFQPTNYLSTKDLIHGLYFVKVTTNDGQVVKKIVKN